VLDHSAPTHNQPICGRGWKREEQESAREKKKKQRGAELPKHTAKMSTPRNNMAAQQEHSSVGMNAEKPKSKQPKSKSGAFTG
jgi:IS4 transposase